MFEKHELLARSADPFFLSVLKVRLKFRGIPYELTGERMREVYIPRDRIGEAEETARQLSDEYGISRLPAGVVSIHGTELFLDYNNQKRQ